MGLSLVFGLWVSHVQSPFSGSSFWDTPGPICYRLDSPWIKFWDRDLHTGSSLGVALRINSCGEREKQNCVERKTELRVSPNKDFRLSNKVLELGWSSRIADWSNKVRTLYPCSGFPGGTSGKESVCQCRRHKNHRFYPWSRKTPWRRKGQAIPVFLAGESHGQRSLAGYSPRVAKSQTQLKQLSMHVWTQRIDVSNCGAGEESWEPLGQQGDQNSQS